MKKLVIFYSYTGTSRRIANEIALRENADIYEVYEKKRPSMLKACIVGSFEAMQQKTTELQPITIDIASYDRIVALGPIWAGLPAPAFNSLILAIPFGKEVILQMVSGGGKSRGKQKVPNLAMKCEIIKYMDVKG